MSHEPSLLSQSWRNIQGVCGQGAADVAGDDVCACCGTTSRGHVGGGTTWGGGRSGGCVDPPEPLPWWRQLLMAVTGAKGEL